MQSYDIRLVPCTTFRLRLGYGEHPGRHEVVSVQNPEAWFMRDSKRPRASRDVQASICCLSAVTLVPQPRDIYSRLVSPCVGFPLSTAYYLSSRDDESSASAYHALGMTVLIMTSTSVS